MEKAEKLRRLEATKRRVPHMSASALGELLKDIEEHGMPGLSGRKHVKEATVKALDMSSYGDLVESLIILGKENAKVTVVFANFFTLLQGFFLKCKPFRELLISTIASKEGGQLTLCFYADEVQPGNSLAVEQNRLLSSMVRCFQ